MNASFVLQIRDFVRSGDRSANCIHYRERYVIFKDDETLVCRRIEGQILLSTFTNQSLNLRHMKTCKLDNAAYKIISQLEPLYREKTNYYGNENAKRQSKESDTEDEQSRFKQYSNQY